MTNVIMTTMLTTQGTKISKNGIKQTNTLAISLVMIQESTPLTR